jgi:hypothetical protein
MNQEKTLLKLLANQANNPAYGKPENIKGPLPKFAVNAEQAEAYEKNNVNEGLGEAIRRRVDSYVDNTIKENMPSGSSEADFENTKKALALAQDAGSFIGSIKAVKGAGKLAMDQASRMARAKEMGFDVDTPQFHGTNAEKIEEFDPNLSKKKLWGKGTYFSNDAGEAGTYGNNVGEYRLKTSDVFDVFKEEATPKSILEVIKKRAPKDFEDMAKSKMLDPYNLIDGAIQAKIITPDELTDLLKQEGYSGLKMGSFTNIFDPENIRSIDAAFDPKKANSKNILAGTLAVTSLSQLLKEDK